MALEDRLLKLMAFVPGQVWTSSLVTSSLGVGKAHAWRRLVELERRGLLVSSLESAKLAADQGRRPQRLFALTAEGAAHASALRGGHPLPPPPPLAEVAREKPPPYVDDGLLAALTFYRQGDEITAVHLAWFLGMSRSAARNQLARLERQGYLSSALEAQIGADTQSRRPRRIYVVTEAGRNRVAVMGERRAAPAIVAGPGLRQDPGPEPDRGSGPGMSDPFGPPPSAVEREAFDELLSPIEVQEMLRLSRSRTDKILREIFAGRLVWVAGRRFALRRDVDLYARSEGLPRPPESRRWKRAPRDGAKEAR